MLKHYSRYLQAGCWYRRVAQGGTITLSQHIYHVKHTLARQDVEITFDADTQHLLFHDASGSLIVSRPILGISVDSLMGQLAQRFNLPAFQLALPFANNPFAAARLFETLQVSLYETQQW
ncbi:MAG: hypothetical protein R3194_14595 [Limnobacter sp.]|nr:hypothetical protein [Limnobacter sp.]